MNPRPISRFSDGAAWAPAASDRRGAGAFTLIELILVMAILVIVLGLVAPSLGPFFKGRVLDSEARRILTLTRYAQERAIAEGVPMVLWLDPDLGRYGLMEEISYRGTDDRRAVEYRMADEMELEVPAITAATVNGTGANTARERAGTTLLSQLGVGRNATLIRFQPDGFMAEDSPLYLGVRRRPDGETGPRSGGGRRSVSTRAGGANDVVWLAPAQNRMGYEIRTNLVDVALR